jgi:hypothetical protein
MLRGTRTLIASDASLESANRTFPRQITGSQTPAPTVLKADTLKVFPREELVSVCLLELSTHAAYCGSAHFRNIEGEPG